MPDFLDEEMQQENLKSMNKEQSQKVGTIIGLILAPIMISAIFLTDYLQGRQCSPLSLQHGQLLSGSNELVFGLLGATIAMVVFLCLISYRYFYGKKYFVATLLAGLLVLPTVASYFDGVENYFCITPTNIVVHAGIFAVPKTYNWNDITSVTSKCYAFKRSRGRSGALGLTFGDGQEVPFGLVNGSQILMTDYDKVRTLLKSLNYRYQISSSVTPDQCPPELYPLFRNWSSP
jgi:hypothetical protein